MQELHTGLGKQLGIEKRENIGAINSVSVRVSALRGTLSRL